LNIKYLLSKKEAHREPLKILHGQLVVVIMLTYIFTGGVVIINGAYTQEL